MDKIKSLLKTPEGARALKAKLKSMPKSEKAKASFKKIWLLTCKSVNTYDMAEISRKKREKKLELQAAQAKKRKLPKPVCLTKKQVTDAIARLVSLYPALFNCENPKPLKLNITDDILASSDWEDKKLLNLAISQYVKNEQYNLALIHQSHRYDLSGEISGLISPDEKSHAIERLNHTLGTFEMAIKYPDLRYTKHKNTPKVLREEFYGKHYLNGQLYREVWMTLVGCYGTGITLQAEKFIDRQMRHAVVKVIQGKHVLFEVKGQGETRKIAKNIALILLLLKVRREIKAYPFDYEVPTLTDQEIIDQYRALKASKTCK